MADSLKDGTALKVISLNFTIAALLRKFKRVQLRSSVFPINTTLFFVPRNIFPKKANFPCQFDFLFFNFYILSGIAVSCSPNALINMTCISALLFLILLYFPIGSIDSSWQLPKFFRILYHELCLLQNNGSVLTDRVARGA